ncbi:MAG: Ig-like domain-containing protein [Alphaproteobacteria bacterium]|nr:Ig-like domain-containing protein [Alphaproteobacteria bacterium]
MCATILVGASAYAFAAKEVGNVHIGVFNTKEDAQGFYESLPQGFRDLISNDQLWLDVYKSPRGFLEHHINISDLDLETASGICENMKRRKVQCVFSGSEPLFGDSETVENTGVSDQVARMPALMQPRGLSVLSSDFNSDRDWNLALNNDYPSAPYAALQDQAQQHAQIFSFEPQGADTAEVAAAKAAYDTVRNKFLQAAQNIGDGVNVGQSEEALRENLMALGRDMFDAAGNAYMSDFWGGGSNKAKALSENADAREAFVYHMKKNIQSEAKSTVSGLVGDLMSAAATDGLDEGLIRQKTDGFVLAGMRGVVNAGLSAARRSDLYALRNLELEYNLNSFEDAYFSVLTTQPVYQSDDLRHNVFLQGGGIINEDSVDVDDDVNRHTLNLGAAYRYLTVDEKYLLGGNIFFDHQWPYNHSRMSIGADAKSKELNFATNYYIPLTGYRDSRTDSAGREYEERALEGFDVEIGYTPPMLPDLSVFGRGYNYFRDEQDDLRGLELSAEYKVLNNFVMRGALVEENGGRDGFEVALQYRVPLYDVDKPNLALADMEPAAGSKSVRDKIFEKVRRENRIRVEERLKNNTGAVNITAQFNALSSALPYDVGGTPTGAGVNLPFDTAITVPNGEFGIIEFSNGAIANVSASGGGDVILEFNATTLTVTATNGGFVQFISGSGGISTINVPGGTVNLLGTDIDVTDDGITTTIQVRAGNIEVVPTIGAAVLAGSQGDVVSLTIASGATSLLVDPALEARQEAAFTNLDLINPSPPATDKSAPFISALPQLITGPQFVGNNADIRLTFSQPVSVSGAPFLNGLVGINARTFAYNPGASTPSQLVFRHTYIAADVGAASMTIQDLDLNGGTIQSTTSGLDSITAFTDTVVPVNDLTAPSLVSSTPADEEPAFAVAADIVLNFDENVQAGVGNIAITDLTDGSSSVLIPIGDAQVTIAGSTVTIDLTGTLDLITDYEVIMLAGVIEDTSGNDFAGLSSGDLNFTTSNDVTPPMLVSSTPNDNDMQIARNSTITLTFDEDVAVAGTINLVDTDDGSGSVSYTSASPEVSVVNNVITITPAANLEYAENYEVTWAAGAIQDLSANNAAASNSGDLNFQSVNLEAALTLTLNVTGPDGNIDETNVQGSGTPFARTSSAVFATDINIPAVPDGVIYEGGGTGIGAWVGFNNGDGVFRARAGDGVALPDTDAASAELALGSIPSGDYTLTWEFDVAIGRVRVWLDETLIASDTAVAGNFESNTWAGTDNFGYGAITAGNSSVATGEITTAFNGTLLSPLRYYSSQTLP